MPHAFRAYPPATKELKPLNARMIGAHILWEGVTGEVTARVIPQLNIALSRQ